MDATKYRAFRSVLERQLQQALHEGDEPRARQVFLEQLNLKREYFLRAFGLTLGSGSYTVSSI